ncbi:MAG: PQQ-binding-like beta-propeller repeat protein [Armatimonadota bacterium]|nr:PQQ-like beta-propeller repeat protein [bacterium]
MNRVLKSVVLVVICQLAVVAAYGATAIHPPFVKAWGFKTEGNLLHYVASKDTIFYSAAYAYGAVDLARGHSLWKNEKSGSYDLNAVFDSNNLYIDTEGKIVARHPRTGKLLWSIPKSGDSALLAVHDNTLYCELEDGVLTALDTRICKVRWKSDIGAEPHPNYTPCTVGMSCNPLFRKDRMYVGTADGKVLSINPRTGNVLWRHKAKIDSRDDALVHGLAADAQHIYFTVCGGSIYALDPHSGTLAWTFNIKNANDCIEFGMPLLFKDMALVGTYTGRVYAIGISDGLQRWNIKLPHEKDPAIISPEDEPMNYSLAVDSGQVIAGAEPHLLAFNTLGKQVWNWNTDNYLSYCPITLLRDGILVASDDALYRFRMARLLQKERGRASSK